MKKAKAEAFPATEYPAYPRVEKPDGLLCDFTYTSTRVLRISREVFLKNRLVAIDETSPESDYFKLLRTQLFQATRQRGMNTIQVTGFNTGDGATLIAFNLAVSIARDTRQTTLLVELNFRNPSICSLLEIPEAPGIKAHLLDRVPLEELFFSPGVNKLSLLTSGGRMPGSTELLGSPGMEALMGELKGRYADRYIIVDTPGIGECPDPLVTSEYMDGIILVARASHTSKDTVRSALDLLPREKVLGIVMNDLSDDEL